jgi:hypothetical protein
MTVIGAGTAPDGGSRPIHRFLVPNGATISIPEGAILLGTAEDGTPVMNIAAVYSSAMVWQVWLELAFGHLQDTKAARERLTAAAAVGDYEAEGVALAEEFSGSLQAISAAVFALDAFYGVIQSMVVVPEAEKEARRRNRAGRDVWVADAINRASRMPSHVARTLRQSIHTAYQARDGAVHPRTVMGDFAWHPAVPNAPVPQLYADYVLEGSASIVPMVTEAMMWVTDRPARRNEAIGAFASVASGILHRVADPHVKIDPASPLYRQE